MVTAYYRGFVCKNPLSKAGGMVAVGLGKTAVEPFLAPGVGIACDNSNASVTLSGDADVLEKVSDEIKTKQDQVFIRALRVEMAYHSGKMIPSTIKMHSVV